AIQVADARFSESVDLGSVRRTRPAWRRRRGARRRRGRTSGRAAGASGSSVARRARRSTSMLKQKALMTLGVCAALVTSAGAQAPQTGASGTARPMTLTTQDYIDIQQLVSKYAYAIDNCTNNGYDYADLYTEDGWFAASRTGRPPA